MGNSYTASNNLPQLVENLAYGQGHTVVTGANAPGGYWLADHYTNSTSLNLMAQGIWDYVVLQEQSQVPTIPYYRENSMVPAARFLDSLIIHNEAQTLFFLTWGRRHGGQQIINGYASYPFIDFFQMQDTLNGAYLDIAQELNATVAPVGMAWAQAVTLNPQAELWQEDNSHPTLQGSYLTACVFYATLFNCSPVGLFFTAGLNAQTALFLQYAAELATTSTESKPRHFDDGIEPQVFPNPYNSTTTFNYLLTSAGRVKLHIYNSSGRLVTHLTSAWQPVGLHQLILEGSNLSSGVYLYNLTAGELTTSGKIVLLK